MEKDKRIISAELNVKVAKENVQKAREMLEVEHKKLCETYEEVFEEKVCKKGEVFKSEKYNIFGYFKCFRVDYGCLLLIWCPKKKDGTMSKSERLFIFDNKDIETFYKLQ